MIRRPPRFTPFPYTTPFRSNGNVSSTTDYTTTAPGTYYWVASYSGDGNNKAAATACGDNNEMSVVGKAQPSITTTAVTGVTVGDKIHETATLTGLIHPTGSALMPSTPYNTPPSGSAA